MRTVALRAAVIPSDSRCQGRQSDVSVLNEHAYARTLHVTLMHPHALVKFLAGLDLHDIHLHHDSCIYFFQVFFFHCQFKSFNHRCPKLTQAVVHSILMAYVSVLVFFLSTSIQKQMLLLNKKAFWIALLLRACFILVGHAWFLFHQSLILPQTFLS